MTFFGGKAIFLAHRLISVLRKMIIIIVSFTVQPYMV